MEKLLLQQLLTYYAFAFCSTDRVKISKLNQDIKKVRRSLKSLGYTKAEVDEFCISAFGL